MCLGRGYVWREWSIRRDILVEEKKYVRMKCSVGVGLRGRESDGRKKMFGSKICEAIFASRLRKTGKFLESGRC